MTDSNKENQHIKLSKRIIYYILSAIILGAIGSGVWEIIAKPGLTTLSRTILDILTFGSKTLKDAAYSSAAMNPTPLPSLILLSATKIIPFLIAIYVFMEQFIKPKIEINLRKIYLKSLKMKEI
jgi:hypothetical protein